MKRLIWYHMVLFTLLVTACSKQEKSTPIAQVGNKILSLEELKQVVPNELSEGDSALWAEDFINKWIRQELLVLAAEQNLSFEQKDVEKELDDYRNSLLTYRYKKELMSQKMDTVVLNNEIESYYFQHQQEYILDKNIVRAVYMKVPLEVSDPESIKNMCLDDSPDKQVELDEYGIRYAKAYDRFNDEWIDINELLEQTPKEISDQERFLRRNKFIESSDTDYYYFICIRDFRLAGDIAPMEYVSSEITNILLNQRKIRFLKEIENDVYEEALGSNKFKIFNVQK